MRRLQRSETTDLGYHHESPRKLKRSPSFDGFTLGLSKPSKGSSAGISQCAECGGDVKVFISPRRNPHSSKLGRAVSLKDHDLCRRCWRRLMHQQRKIGVIELPLSMFIGGRNLRPRLLINKPPFLPKTAS